MIELPPMDAGCAEAAHWLQTIREEIARSFAIPAHMLETQPFTATQERQFIALANKAQIQAPGVKIQ